jgi:glutamate-1-semialdehyde 2,1-aminomutase
MKTEISKEKFEEACKYLVGGVNSPVRSFKGVGGQPLIMKEGKRSKFIDLDGNEYTDYCLSWGSLILGHANRNVVLAAKKTAERGLSFGTTTYAEIEMARQIVESVPSIDLVRFVNSGTEATMSAIRLARGFTKKDIVIKFDGGYHGHVDDLLTVAGSGVAQLQESSSKGIPQAHLKNTISLPYNDSAAVTKVIKERVDEIACVIIEPVAGNMGVIPGKKEFLQTLRDLTAEHSIVLIFDEIMSGFRSSKGCVQSDYNIIPDVTCLGKIISSGFPIGCYGGRREIMECLAPLGSVYQAGTFSGNPVVMKAGLAGLRQLNDNVYAKLNKKCKVFAEDLNSFFKEKDIDAHLSTYCSKMSLRFRREEVLNYEDAIAAQGHEKYTELFHFLLKKGIYLPPADLEAFFISTSHSKDDIDELSAALKDFFTNI